MAPQEEIFVPFEKNMKVFRKELIKAGMPPEEWPKVLRTIDVVEEIKKGKKGIMDFIWEVELTDKARKKLLGLIGREI